MALLKRLFKTRFSTDDLFSYAGSLISNPPQDGGYVKHLTEQRSSSGKLQIDSWRDDIKDCLNQIAAEPSWSLQKLRALKLLIHQAKWNAIGNALISEGRDVNPLWQEWVENTSWFKENPREYWFDMAITIYMMCVLNHTVLYTVAISCFGVKSSTLKALNAYREIEKEGLTKNIHFNSALQFIWSQFPNSKPAFDAQFKNSVEDAFRKKNDLMKEFSEAICVESINVDYFSNEYAKRANTLNNLLVQFARQVGAALPQ
jgi:hypothetical protein